MLFNTVVFVLVIRVLLKHSARKLSDVDRKTQFQGTFKTMVSVVSIMVMFGLQWLFGAFTIADASVAFQWLFVIFSTLQGFLLFVFFCVLGKDAREEWLNVFSFGFRKKKKRGVYTSHASQATRRDRNTGSTYITSKHSNTLKKSALLSVSGDTTTELCSRRNIYLAMPTSTISEVQETEFVYSNGNADLTDGPQGGKVELVNGHSGDLNMTEKQPPVEVPPHILERRFLYRYNPAVVNSPPLKRKADNEEEDDEDTLTSEASTTDCYDVSTADYDVSITADYDASTKADYGDLTQRTELSVLTNSDVSDTEEISRL